MSGQGTGHGGRAPDTGRKLTGRTVAVIFFACFGLVVAVNGILMVQAVGTFSGLVVPNSYVASQSFDANRTAQEALGWELGLDYRDGALHVTLKDAGNRTVRPRDIRITVGRTTSERADSRLALEETPAGYAAPLALTPGIWRADIEAIAEDGTGFVQYRTLYVPAPPA